jgi:hypothetical protein
MDLYTGFLADADSSDVTHSAAMGRLSRIEPEEFLWEMKPPIEAPGSMCCDARLRAEVQIRAQRYMSVTGHI